MQSSVSITVPPRQTTKFRSLVVENVSTVESLTSRREESWFGVFYVRTIGGMGGGGGGEKLQYLNEKGKEVSFAFIPSSHRRSCSSAR